MEQKCKECGSDIETRNIEVGINLCMKCDEKNWITDPTEIAKALKADPLLQKPQFIHEIKEIIFGNARKGSMCEDAKDGQLLGLRTGEGLEFDNLALGLYEYIKDNFLLAPQPTNNE